MLRTMMKAKIHRATVTEANLNYVGSVTIDEELLERVDILPGEKVQIVNNNNGARLETYVIPGPRGSRTVCLNGAAARLVQPGDKVIIIAYALMDEEEIKRHRPRIAIMGDQNEILEVIGEEVHGTAL
ncbi:L-aspartate 1-decarboxylase [Planifilum fulgidum]|jgi:aspartate 1-decarboxylase|uniref:Aspartate 1-decarboxylase n=1 Tax=Planifilum fulgidum TaxID=201973 RepID=A0A1I2LF75_9BACL|nr:aspartate 1-decarboxylase [Planifilum fulgidum]MBO2496459.1 aspartate 1-decarboxylase [Bacillota bacterium]MBO2531544.1 aspartate 1-decarboxylase [Thermoactinomycetaceae bacterium]SFF76107.1 L-aspartate 1-decarboxylase [Planifilum fulgidum]